MQLTDLSCYYTGRLSEVPSEYAMAHHLAAAAASMRARAVVLSAAADGKKNRAGRVAAATACLLLQHHGVCAARGEECFRRIGASHLCCRWRWRPLHARTTTTRHANVAFLAPNRTPIMAAWSMRYCWMERAIPSLGPLKCRRQ
jgi:hypothetical protein